MLGWAANVEFLSNHVDCRNITSNGRARQRQSVPWRRHGHGSQVGKSDERAARGNRFLIRPFVRSSVRSLARPSLRLSVCPFVVTHPKKGERGQASAS